MVARVHGEREITMEPNEEYRVRAADANLSPRPFDEIEGCD